MRQKPQLLIFFQRILRLIYHDILRKYNAIKIGNIMSLEHLKRNKKSISALAAEAEKVAGGKKNFDDDRYWKPTVDKAGNAFAVIRYLPAPEGNDLPWVEYYDHGFQGPSGQWYIEKCLTTLKQPDPVAELNTELWNSSNDDASPGRRQARAQKRRRHFVSNIYVVTDSANPDAEGKVFLFKYGKKIFDKNMDAMQPKFEDEVAIDPFDLWEGANFKLKQRKVEDWPNFDKSEFEKPSPLFKDDKKLEEVYGKTYDLRTIVAASEFKSYDELKAKMNRVLQLDKKPSSAMDNEPATQARSVGKTTQSKYVAEEVEDEDKDEKSSLSYFEKLAAAED